MVRMCICDELIRAAQQEKVPSGCSKRPDFSSAQPWRLFHPLALSLPRQTLYPGTRLIPSKALASGQAEVEVERRVDLLNLSLNLSLSLPFTLADFFSILLAGV